MILGCTSVYSRRILAHSCHRVCIPAKRKQAERLGCSRLILFKLIFQFIPVDFSISRHSLRGCRLSSRHTGHYTDNRWDHRAYELTVCRLNLRHLRQPSTDHSTSSTRLEATCPHNTTSSCLRRIVPAGPFLVFTKLRLFSTTGAIREARTNWGRIWTSNPSVPGSSWYVSFPSS